jgi:hypothetical protein
MKTAKAFVSLMVVGVVLGVFGYLITGCSSYGHQSDELPPPIDNPMRGGPDEPGVGPVYGGDGCIPGTCCNPSSCNPACPDGYVCMAAKCINVLQVCGAK